MRRYIRGYIREWLAKPAGVYGTEDSRVVLISTGMRRCIKSVIAIKTFDRRTPRLYTRYGDIYDCENVSIYDGVELSDEKFHVPEVGVWTVSYEPLRDGSGESKIIVTEPEAKRISEVRKVRTRTFMDIEFSSPPGFTRMDEDEQYGFRHGQPPWRGERTPRKKRKRPVRDWLLAI